MSFIKANTGDYLNTNVIPKVRPTPTGTGGSAGTRFVEEARRDGAVPILEAVLGDLESASAPLTPPGQITLAVFVYTDDGDGCPVAVQAEPVPVIGWRVHKDNPVSTVFAFTPSGRGTMLLPVGNERLVGPGQLYGNVEDAKADLLRSAQTAWDCDHPGEIVDKPKLAAGGRRHAR